MSDRCDVLDGNDVYSDPYADKFNHPTSKPSPSDFPPANEFESATTNTLVLSLHRHVIENTREHQGGCLPGIRGGEDERRCRDEEIQLPGTHRHTQRERERERERGTHKYIHTNTHTRKYNVSPTR